MFRSVRRYPLVIVVLSVAAGIVLGRYAGIPSAAFAATGLAGVCFWGVVRSKHQSRLAWYGLTIGFCCVGALHYQLALLVPQTNELRSLVSIDSQLVRVRGTIVDAPTVFAAPPPRWEGERPQTDLTRCEIACSEVFRGDVWQPISGVLRADVSGLASDLNAGDSVDVSGWLGDLPEPHNPGQLDTRLTLLSRGVCGTLRIESPDVIVIRQRNQSLRSQVRRQLRSRFEQTLQRGLSSETQPLGRAILLGDRSRLAKDTRLLFVESGTMHLLAISGLHVGIIALFLYGLARLVRCPPRVAALVMLAVLTLYIDAADARPPMIRAFILIGIWTVSRLLNRPSFSSNSLATAGIILLAMNPTTLFDVGAQLSFLAVATIMWCIALGRRRDDDRRVDIAVAPDSPRARDALRPPWQRWLFVLLRNLRRPLAISSAIWGLSAPLAASTFNILAPIGILLNVVLIPLVSVALCFGFFGLLIGIADSDSAVAPLTVFDFLLRLLMRIARPASQFQWGHVAVGAIPLWWLFCIYSLTAAAMLRTVWRKRASWLWLAAVLWLLFGFALSGTSARARASEPELTCTFLSVGHGLSIVVEFPNGRVLVYDCGSAGWPEAAANSLQRFVSARGIRAIDALLVSHSDADHFNGIEMLGDSDLIDQLLISRHFPDAAQPGTIALLETAEDRSIPIEMVERGDRLAIDPSVSIEILHPAAAAEFESDNAASVVLQIEFAGRRVLLTGDLEDGGLQSLLRQPARDVDVLLAPHHGALDASPPELVDWARPRFVVASARRRFDPRQIEARYGPESRVLTTSQSGAIEFRILSTGEIQTREFLSRADW